MPKQANTWAARYEPTVEMPILLITLSTPLPRAYTVFWTAFAGVRSPNRPASAMSSTVSSAR